MLRSNGHRHERSTRRKDHDRRRSRSKSRSSSPDNLRSRSHSPARTLSRYKDQSHDKRPDMPVLEESSMVSPILNASQPPMQPAALRGIKISGAAPPLVKPDRSTLMGRLGLPINSANGTVGIGIIGRAAGRGRGAGTV